MLSTALPIASKRQFRPRLRGCYAVKEQHEQSHQFAPSLAQRRDGGDVRAGAVQDSSLSLNLTPSIDAVHQQGVTYQPALYAAQQEEAEQVEAIPQATDTSASAQASPPPNDVKTTLREIAALSIPALGSVLADPICSLADTACVGQAGQSLQLAALSPCTAIFNMVFLVFQFVGVTITNKLASNSPTAAGLTSEESAQREQENQRLVSYSLTFAVISGIVTAAGLICGGPQMLAAMGTSAEMMPAALAYLSLRALAAPAVMIMNVCQGICLGQQNSLSPLLVFSGVGLLNVVLDMWLILGQGMGCAGAAVATAVAQWLGAAYFFNNLRRKGVQGTSVPLKWMGLPKPSDLQPFIGMASVLLSRTIFSMSAYTLVTGVATAQGTVVAASHQVCLQLFWFLSYFPEPLSVSAQSLIARDRDSKSRVLLLTRCIAGAATALGMVIAGVCAGLFVFSAGAFSPDPLIAETMQSVAAPAFSALILCALAMSLDGISIGSNDFDHLPAVNLAGLAGTVGWLQWCTTQGLGLPGIWTGMVVMFGVRLAVHLLHHLGMHSNTSVVAEAFGWRNRARKTARGLQSLPMPALVTGP
eukprot:jgi/Ulvmu1/11262/UM073_0034.1